MTALRLPSGSWRVRVASAVALVVAVVGCAALLGYDPRPVRLALLVLVCVVGAWLVVDALVDDAVDWSLPDETTTVVPPGTDRRLTSHAHLLASHLTAAEPDRRLQDRLAHLADRRLVQRHGVRLTDAAGRERLGPEVADLLAGPPRRVRRREAERIVRAIEEL